MLTIFANIRINSKGRLKNLIQSYNSMDGISDDWLINIRGRYRKKAINYLKPRLKDKATYFNLLDETRGWMTNSLDMIDKAKYNYLLVWNEDHANTAPISLYPKILKEMDENNVEYMIYSWWFFSEIRERFNNQKIKEGKHIDTILLTHGVWENMKKEGYSHYIISMVAIFRKDLLRKFLIKDSQKWPVIFSKFVFYLLGLGNKIKPSYNMHLVFGKINMRFGNHLARYPKETPFELEKDPERVDVLPVKIGLPKRELFACLDEDAGVEGYQLLKRQHNKKILKIIKPWGYEEVLETNNDYTVKRLFMAQGKRCSLQYHRFKKETIIGVSGELTIIINDRKIILRPGKTITIRPLTIHRMWAISGDCLYLECSTSELNDVIRVDDDFGRKGQNETPSN